MSEQRLQESGLGATSAQTEEVATGKPRHDAMSKSFLLPAASTVASESSYELAQRTGPS